MQEELALESEFYDDNGDKEPEYGILHYSSPHSFVHHSSEHEVYNDRSENSSMPQRPEIEVQPADAQTVFNEEFEINNEIESDYDGDFVEYENDELSNLSSENNISEPCHTDSRDLQLQDQTLKQHFLLLVKNTSFQNLQNMTF